VSVITWHNLVSVITWHLSLNYLSHVDRVACGDTQTVACCAQAGTGGRCLADQLPTDRGEGSGGAPGPACAFLHGDNAAQGQEGAEVQRAFARPKWEPCELGQVRASEARIHGADCLRPPGAKGLGRGRPLGQGN
jgi:hypothetical protein